MNNRGIRHRLLHSSVMKLIGPEEQVDGVVVVWSRHRWFLPYAAAAGFGIFLLTTALGVPGVANRLALGGCGVAVAAMSTTNYWVLARTGTDFVLCRSSRIRQYATALVRRLPPDVELTMVGSTVVTSDWRIDGVEYTLSKRWESAMRAMAADGSPR